MTRLILCHMNNNTCTAQQSELLLCSYDSFMHDCKSASTMHVACYSNLQISTTYKLESDESEFILLISSVYSWLWLVTLYIVSDFT